MNTSALEDVLAGPETFGGKLRERVEQLVHLQLTRVLPEQGWVVLPLARAPQGLHLLATSAEATRRGREIVTAFLGPAQIHPITVDISAGAGKDHLLLDAGLGHCLHLLNGPVGASVFGRIEDAVAAVSGREARPGERTVNHIDLLRDLRLSLLNRDAAAAEANLEQLTACGRMSGENLRFLHIQLLGGMGRWEELAALPHLPDLLRTRRPREVNDTILQMLWWTEIQPRLATGADANAVFEQAGLQERFGAVLHAVDVPATAASRGTALLVAHVIDDLPRLQRILAAAQPEEQAAFDRILHGPPVPSAPVGPSGVRELFDQGRYDAAVDLFCEQPSAGDADLALEAALETGSSGHGARLLPLLDRFITNGSLRETRRVTRDLDELRRLVDDSCTCWPEWVSRLTTSDWPTADAVARDQHSGWPSLRDLPRSETVGLFSAIADAWDGPNQSGIATVLDLICDLANEAMAEGITEVADEIFVILLEQKSITEPVRDAFLDCFCTALNLAPQQGIYAAMLHQAGFMWERIGSASAIEWALELLDTLTTCKCTDPGARTQLATAIVNELRPAVPSLKRHQQVDLQALAVAVGVECQIPAAQTVDAEADVWAKLDQQTVGLYSLLAHAGAELGGRLATLSPTATVQANADQVATDALKSLARKADHLIVDTWHATHQATNAINDVRPKNRQILPRRRGISGFVSALEEHLT